MGDTQIVGDTGDTVVEAVMTVVATTEGMAEDIRQAVGDTMMAMVEAAAEVRSEMSNASCHSLQNYVVLLNSPPFTRTRIWRRRI